MKYFYTILIIGIILLLWFAPINLESERQMANTGPRMIVLYIFENTWLKIIITIFLGLIALGLHGEEQSE
jgi:hypothetical protein